MLQKLKELLLEHTLTLVVIPALVLFGTLLWAVFPPLFEPLWLRLEPRMLQRILGLALLAILVLLAYVLYLHHRLRNRLRVVFGIKWDRNLTAYCPGCDKPLTEYKEGRSHTGPHFSCLTCHSALGIHDDTGRALTLLEAKQRLRSN